MNSAGYVQLAVLLWYIWSLEGLPTLPVLQQGILVCHHIDELSSPNPHPQP